MAKGPAPPVGVADGETLGVPVALGVGGGVAAPVGDSLAELPAESELVGVADSVCDVLGVGEPVPETLGVALCEGGHVGYAAGAGAGAALEQLTARSAWASATSSSPSARTVTPVPVTPKLKPAAAPTPSASPAGVPRPASVETTPSGVTARTVRPLTSSTISAPAAADHAMLLGRVKAAAVPAPSIVPAAHAAVCDAQPASVATAPVEMVTVRIR